MDGRWAARTVDRRPQAAEDGRLWTIDRGGARTAGCGRTGFRACQWMVVCSMGFPAHRAMARGRRDGRWTVEGPRTADGGLDGRPWMWTVRAAGRAFQPVRPRRQETAGHRDSLAADGVARLQGAARLQVQPVAPGRGGRRIRNLAEGRGCEQWNSRNFRNGGKIFPLRGNDVIFLHFLSHHPGRGASADGLSG
jgi:hypothetical protein